MEKTIIVKHRYKGIMRLLLEDIQKNIKTMSPKELADKFDLKVSETETEIIFEEKE